MVEILDIKLNAGLANSEESIIHRSYFYLIKDAFLRKYERRDCELFATYKTMKEWKELGNANTWKSNVYVSIA